MRKQKTFYNSNVDGTIKSALSNANEWINNVNISFNVTKIEITITKIHSWDSYNRAIVKINFV